jgi:methyl-accepting chemotaxis protein
MQMDQVTQQNAALVEEAAAAADSMQQQAQALSKAVAVFKVVQSNSASLVSESTPIPVSGAAEVSGSSVRAVQRKLRAAA